MRRAARPRAERTRRANDVSAPGVSSIARLRKRESRERLADQRRRAEHGALELSDLLLVGERRHHATGNAVDVHHLKALRCAERRERLRRHA